MTTVRKTKVAEVLDKISSAKCFSLENGFSGKPVDDLAALRSWLVRMEAKVSFDKTTRKGNARLHSNEWYEFEVLA